MASGDVRFQPQHALVLSHSRLKEWDNAYLWVSLATEVSPSLVNTGYWTPREDRSYPLVLFEKAVISLRRGDAEQMARDRGEEMNSVAQHNSQRRKSWGSGNW